MAEFKTSNRLAELRALAQQHLIDIEAGKIQEQTQQSQAEADIQRYAKLSSFDRKQQAQASPSTEASTTSDMGTTTKKDRFRPFNEILHRIKWDSDLNINDYVVGFLERFEGIKELPASNWIGDFTDEDWIPMHRVRYVKRVRITESRGKGSVDVLEDKGPALGIVWDRDARIDKFSRQSSIGDEFSDLQRDDVLSLDGTSVTGGMAL